MTDLTHSPTESRANASGDIATAADSRIRGVVRDDFVPKQPYYEARYVDLEKQRLWPMVWQVACRAEEIPSPGDYVTYQIADESIIVLREDESTLKAYYNVCQHRGRRLTDGCGNAKNFYCRFHGWRWNLDGIPKRSLIATTTRAPSRIRISL